MRKATNLAGMAVLGAVVAACGSSSGSSGGGSSAAPLTSLTVGYYANPNPERIAQQKGWFDQELGVKVSFKPFESGAAMMAAITAGAIQFTCESGTPPIAAAAAQGGDQEIFWVNENAAEALAVKPSAGINSVADLKGKKVGTIVGSTDYFSLAVALQHNNVALSDLQIIDGPVPDLVAAYKRGDLDGVYIPYPGMGEVVAAGGHILLTSDQVSTMYGFPTFDACVVSRAWASSHQDVLTKWVKVEDKAVKYYRSNQTDALAAIAANTGLTVAQASEQSAVFTFPTAQDQTQPRWLGTSSTRSSAGVANSMKLTSQLEVKLGRIAQPLANPENVDDPTFVEAVGKG